MVGDMDREEFGLVVSFHHETSPSMRRDIGDRKQSLAFCLHQCWICLYEKYESLRQKFSDIVLMIEFESKDQFFDEGGIDESDHDPTQGTMMSETVRAGLSVGHHSVTKRTQIGMGDKLFFAWSTQICSWRLTSDTGTRKQSISKFLISWVHRIVYRYLEWFGNKKRLTIYWYCMLNM